MKWAQFYDKNEPIRVTHFSDPGHGWIRVSNTQLKMLPEELREQISGYSYQSETGRYVYLEEDCDAGIFFEWAKGNGFTVIQSRKYTNRSSRIRNLPSYKPKQAFRFS
jgi:hypothetical protein